MTHTEELLALAEAANAFCNKCGYIGKDVPLHKRPSIGDECGYQAARMMWVRPETIKQLVELVRLQHEALNTCDVGDVKYPDDTQFYDDHKVEKAIEAFNKWENGE